METDTKSLTMNNLNKDDGTTNYEEKEDIEEPEILLEDWEIFTKTLEMNEQYVKENRSIMNHLYKENESDRIAEYQKGVFKYQDRLNQTLNRGNEDANELFERIFQISLETRQFQDYSKDAVNYLKKRE